MALSWQWSLLQDPAQMCIFPVSSFAARALPREEGLLEAMFANHL